jgi:hypothetical protein
MGGWFRDAISLGIAETVYGSCGNRDLASRSCKAKRKIPVAALLSPGFILLLVFGALHLMGISATLLLVYWTAKNVAHTLGL